MAKGNEAMLLYEMIILQTLASLHSDNEALNIFHVNYAYIYF